MSQNLIRYVDEVVPDKEYGFDQKVEPFAPKVSNAECSGLLKGGYGIILYTRNRIHTQMSRINQDNPAIGNIDQTEDREDLQFPTERSCDDQKVPNKNNVSPNQEWVEPIIPPKKFIKNATQDTQLDVSNESSDTEVTRSTLSDTGDYSSESGDATGPRRIRSKSLGLKKKKNRLISATSLLPTRSELGPCSMLSSRAREIRIRRMQILKNRYLPLEDGSECMDSHQKFTCENNQLNTSIRSQKSAEQKGDIFIRRVDVDDDSVAGEKVRRNLMADNQDPCPDFNTILESLDLQLIDLRRPIGAEYGDDEVSM